MGTGSRAHFVFWAFKVRMTGLVGGRGKVFHSTSVERPGACVYTADIDATPNPAVCSMDVVAILVKHRVGGEGRPGGGMIFILAV
jgi:hypothetical protein